MAVTTRLQWNEEQSLRKLLGNASLRLLYKSSVHGQQVSEVVERCSHQGSTVTVIHFKTHVVGIFMLEHFPKSHEKLCYGKLNVSIWFTFQKKSTIEISTAILDMVVRVKESLMFFLTKNIQIGEFSNERNAVRLHPLIMKRLGCESENNNDYLECEIFRVDGIKNDPDFIRKIATAPRHRKKLLADLRAYEPHAHVESEIRILLLGPVGSGKSSFFNSVKSIFQGHHTCQAMVGTDETSITEHYRIYSIKDGKNGKPLSFVLCDSMGLDEKAEAGLCIDDVPHILNGYVPDRYQFKPREPITAENMASVTTPSLKHRIHCVAYVLDINSVNTLSYEMILKLKEIHREVVNCDIAHVALLTKVRNYDEILRSDLLNMATNMTSQSQVVNVHKMLGIPMSRILMVDNYTWERELDPLKDVVILSALRQMLRAADDFLEVLSPEKTASN